MKEWVKQRRGKKKVVFIKGKVKGVFIKNKLKLGNFLASLEILKSKRNWGFFWEKRNKLGKLFKNTLKIKRGWNKGRGFKRAAGLNNRKRKYTTTEGYRGKKRETYPYQ